MSAARGTKRRDRRFFAKHYLEGKKIMLKIPETVPVRTRVPLPVWAAAAVVTLFSLMSSLMHWAPLSDHVMPRAEQADQPKVVSHQAKV